MGYYLSNRLVGQISPCQAVLPLPSLSRQDMRKAAAQAAALHTHFVAGK